MKIQDEIVNEVRESREAYSAQFGYDLSRMFEDLKMKEEQNRGHQAKLKPVRPREQTT